MLRLQRKSRLNGRSPMQKLMRRSSKEESVTEPSSSLNFSDDDFGDECLNESPQGLEQVKSDSIYTSDQVVIRPADDERPKVALHTSFGDDSERSTNSTDFDVQSTKKKKKKTKPRPSNQEVGIGKSKSKKSSPKKTAAKTKKKQLGAEKEEDSPFWSLSSMITPTDVMQSSQAADSEDSERFGAPQDALDESFVSQDGSIMLPSKASMEANEERTSLSPRGGRRNQRGDISTATGTMLMPSKASLERTESSKSNKSTKKKRRPKPLKDTSSAFLSPNQVKSPNNGKQDKGDVSAELENFLAKSVSDESSVSSQSQSSKASQKSKGKKTAGSRKKKSKSVSPKKNAAGSLPPAIEDKPSSFSSLQFHSFGDCEEELGLGSPTSKSEPFSVPQEEDSTKIKQPSKARLESMLERVKIRKKTRKGSGASVGSVRRGKRPQASILDSSNHSVVSLDTGMNKSMNKAVRQDSLSGEQSAAISVGSKKKNRRPAPRTIPLRATSYQSKLKVGDTASPSSTQQRRPPRAMPRRAASYRSILKVDDTSTSPSIAQPSKASLQKNLEKRDSIKSRKMSGSRRTALSPERSSALASMNSSGQQSMDPPVISPKSIMKAKLSSSLVNNEASEPITESKVVAGRRASFNGSSKHPSVHALSTYDEGENSKEQRSSSPKRRGTRSPSAKERKPGSRSLSPIAKTKPSPKIKPDSADDPWDSIDEAFMPVTSQESDDMWASLARLDEEPSSCAIDASARSEPCLVSSKRQQQLKATEFMDAWWDVGDDDNQQSLASRKKKLAQKSMLLVSSNSVRSMKSSEFDIDEEEQAVQDNNASRPQSKSPSGRPRSKSPPRSTVAKTTMHVSMPLTSLDGGSSHVPSLKSASAHSRLNGGSSHVPSSLKSASAHSPLNQRQTQSKPKQAEVSDAWWAEDADDAKETKKKLLARKSVLLVGHGSGSMSFDDDDFDDDEEEETIKPKVVMDPRSGRRVVAYPGGRRPASPGRLAVNRRKMTMQPASKNKKVQSSSDDVLGSPQEQQQKKVTAAFKF